MSLEALHTIKKDFGSCSDPRCPSFKRQSCESLNPQGPGHCQAKCLPWAGSLSFTGLRAVTDDQLRDLLLFPHAHLVLFPNASSSSPLWSVMPAPLICTNARNHSCLRGLVAPMSILQILPDNIYICVKPVVRKKKKLFQSISPLILWQIISWLKLKQHKGLWTPTSCHSCAVSWHWSHAARGARSRWW